MTTKKKLATDSDVDVRWGASRNPSCPADAVREGPTSGRPMTNPTTPYLLPGEAELLVERCTACGHLAALHFKDLRYDVFGCDVADCACAWTYGRTR
jgi:hypothetical protein